MNRFLPFAAAILLASSTASRSAPAQVTPGTKTDTIEFFVVASGGPALAKVEVASVSKVGVIPLGLTDDAGRLVVKRTRLVSSEPWLVLCCRPGFFCGAFRVDEEFLRAGDHLISLAPFGVR